MATFYGKASEIENNSNKIDVIKHSDTDKSVKYPSEQAIIDFIGGAEYQDGYVVVGDGSTGGIKSSDIKADYLNTAYTSSLMLEDAAGKIRDGNIVVGSPGTLPYPHYVKDSGVTLADLQSAIDKKATISNALQPYVIPMGSPSGDGSLYGGTGLQISDVVQHSSFNGFNNNEVVKVEKYTETDGKDVYKIVASNISIDDIALNKPLELLNETTLTEDAVVIFNTDSNGNSLSLKKFELLVSLPAVTSATTIWIGINGHCMAFTQASSASAANPTYRIWGEYISVKNNWDFRSAMNSSSGAGLGTMWAFPNGNRYSGTLPSAAHGIIIAGNGALTTALPTGAKITLWGVRE